VYWSPPAPLTVLPLAPQPYLVILVPTGPSSTSPVLRLLALASSRKFHNATILRTTPFMAFIHAHTSAQPSFRLPSRLSPHVTRISSLEFLQKSNLEPPRRRPQRTCPIRGQGQAPLEFPIPNQTPAVRNSAHFTTADSSELGDSLLDCYGGIRFDCIP
jgi:hypothetical protein